VQAGRAPRNPWRDGAQSRPGKKCAATRNDRGLACQLKPQVEIKTTDENKPAAPAEASSAATLAKTLKDLQLDFSIPEMPAFTVIGLTPENVSHPRTARALAAAIKNGIDQNGKLKTGLAVEFAPFRLADPSKVLASYLPGASRGPYTSNTFSQAIQNASISIASAQGTSADDKSMRLGLD